MPELNVNESPNSRRKARQKRVQQVIKYLGLSATGIGIFGIIGFLVKGQFQAAAILGFLTVGVTVLLIAYKYISGVINRVLDKIEEKLENTEEPLVTLIFKGLKTSVINFWWGLNTTFQRSYYQSLVYSFRELKIEGFRIGLPVLDLENVFVSLQVAPEIPENINSAIIQRQVKAEKQEIWDFLAQSSQKKFQAFRHLAVIGSPGSGKTTLLKHLTLIYAKKHNKIYKAPKFIPVLLYLQDIRHLIVVEPPPSLPQLIKEHIHNLPAPLPLTPPPHWVEHQLKTGKLLVMLDGLDDVIDKSQRQQVSQWVNRQMATYRQTVFILTSRPHGYRSAPVEQVGTVLELLPFNSKQVKQFIQSWYLQTEIMSRAGRDTPAVRSEAKNNANDLIERIMNNRAIADMAKNPLLVTMIATVHYCGSALPGRRVELYQRICDLLLGPRQEAKKIETPLTGEQNKSVLQVLALALMRRKTREFTLSQGQELIQAELERVAGSLLTPFQFLKQIKEVSGLLVERELGVYEFAHLSFQEYLAAAQVKELQQDNLLTENLQDPWWAETIRLYAAQSDASNLIRQALVKPTVNSLTLALDCLQECLKVEPAIREQLEEMLEAGLESSDLQIAELAAEVKLSRRLNNLFKIDENLEIDTDYITCAEYQLFVNEWLNSQFHFQPGSAKRPITGISYQYAIQFCTWLNANASSFISNNGDTEDVYYYRLPTFQETQEIAARQESQQLECWTIGESNTSNPERKGIRLIRAKIPTEYTKLANYLVAGEWKKADEETAQIRLKIAGREIEGYIDQLWLHSSGYLIKESIHGFREIWNTGKSVLNQNDMEAFRTNADKLTRLFCESLGFKTLDDSDTFEQLYGQMIDASNPAFQLNIRPSFPLIYPCKTTFSEKDVWKISGLMNKFKISADFFALLVVFDNHQQIRQQLRESPYKNDFIVLNYDQLWNILAANSPIQKLTNCILEQIDLIAVSPYTVYGSVQEKMFFGRAKEEKTLLQNIVKNDYALIANRKMGKTSLLNRIYPRLKRIPNYQIFYCDLQPVSNYVRFYQKLALSNPELKEDISNFSELSPLFFEELISNIKQRNSNRQIIFIFDEVDEILAYDINQNERLFKTFRSLSQSENVRFIFSGTTTLVKRVRHPDSPLFNFCSPIKIGILEEKEAKELVKVPMGALGVKFENEDSIVKRILDLTAQHPNIIQYICDALIKIINEKQKRTITELDLDRVATSQEFYEYFESLIWGQSTTLEKLIVYAMWSYPEFSESEVIEEFKRQGIPSDKVKASLEILLTYSTLSKKNDKYFFTFREFAKLMEERSDIKALTEQYQRELGSSEA